MTPSSLNKQTLAFFVVPSGLSAVVAVPAVVNPTLRNLAESYPAIEPFGAKLVNLEAEKAENPVLFCAQ